MSDVNLMSHFARRVLVMSRHVIRHLRVLAEIGISWSGLVHRSPLSDTAYHDHDSYHVVLVTLGTW